MTTYSIIPPHVPFVGRDGRIAREWYLFIVNLFKSAGGGEDTVTLDSLEAVVLAAMRGPNTSGIESALRELAAALHLQRSDRCSMNSLERRVADLEELLQNQRPPIADARIAELQTLTLGSRPWL